MTSLDLIYNLIPSVFKAGEKIMTFYNNGAQLEIKDDGSPVTEADKASEEIILTELQKIIPNVPVISEENLPSHNIISSKKFFLVDPLDGTKEFLKKDSKGSFTVNIGLIENNFPKMGIVYAPALNQMFFGYQNAGAWKIEDGKKRRITVCKPKNNQVTAVASTSHRDPITNQWLKKNNITNVKSIGSSLKFCLVASGKADVYPRFSPTMEWDTAAGDAILRAAGGAVTNPNRENLTYGKNSYRNNSFIAWGGYSSN